MKAAGIALGLAVMVALGLGVRAAPVAASRATRMQGAVVLRPRDPAGLQRFIAAVSDHGSMSYGRYLRPGEFAARFGPTTASVAAITAQLRARGLRVGPVSDSRMLIPFSGSAAAGAARPRGARRALLAGLSGPVAAVVGPGTTTRAAPAGVPHPVPSQVARHRAARAASLSHPAGSPRACPAARAASIAADG
ncbi:MAG TPA: protease pro-enzyme activation domain-containing protein, partial [Solirubrobacteraceae bacterium]|nr:protease pro-enzyme activation domain-containing protein [Solirubrobacteraceae bacterium]